VRCNQHLCQIVAYVWLEDRDMSRWGYKTFSGLIMNWDW
jgi:hypothetical protein